MDEKWVKIYKRAAELGGPELGRGVEARDLLRSRQMKLFQTDEDVERKELERMLYEPQLRNGGDMERRIVGRLKKIARIKNFADSWRAAQAINDWRAVLPENPRNAGHYYVCAPVTARTNKEDYDWFRERLKAANADRNWDKKWFYELLLEGRPEPVADFEINCLFLVECADGDTQRLVELRNVEGEIAGPVNIDPDAYHAPQKFRRWCAARGNFSWGAGEKGLQKLHLDIGRLAAWRKVKQVSTLGWYPLGEPRRGKDGRLECDGIWFFGDAVRASTMLPGGTISDEWLHPDKDGIYWHRTTDQKTGEPVDSGYLLSDIGWEGTIKVPFYQKKPLLYPDERIAALPLSLAPCPELNFAGQTDGSKYEPDTDPGKNAENDLKILRIFFRELCQRMGNVVGVEEACFIIGWMLSFAGAPEIYAKHSLFPGGFLHGQPNSGKSTIAELVMEIQGFSVHSGMMLKGRMVSAVGLAQAAAQYSNLFVWADEFKNGEVDDDKMSVLHAAYNRQTPAKFNTTGYMREMRTNFLVSGEMTSTSAALRSRFPHVQVAATTRKGTKAEQDENIQWLQNHRTYFHVFGRHVIEHRREFVRLVQDYLKVWCRQPGDPRLMILHGVGYASWMAMASLFGSHSASEVEQFKEWLLIHTRQATDDFQSDQNINLFIEDLITAVKMDAIPLQCFRVIGNHVQHPPGAPNQASGWVEYVLLIDPEPTIAALNIWLTKQRQALPLKRKDLRDQLSRNPYWYRRFDANGDEKKISVRFGDSRSGTSHAWGIIADEHPLGYRQVPDEDVEEYLLHPATGDPRKGPLFTLIEKVLTEQNKQEDEANR